MLKKAVISVEGGSDIRVMYNPSEINDARTVELQGAGANLQFKRLTQKDFTVSLFFDSYEERRDIRTETKKIEALMVPSKGTVDRRRPPICTFSWGSFSYRGIVTGLSQRFVMFLETGDPVRAWLTVTFQSVLTEKQELKAQGVANSRKMWTVKWGDRLDLIANATLGDPSLWRMIATANDVANPTAFPTAADVGSELIVPDLHAKKEL